MELSERDLNMRISSGASLDSADLKPSLPQKPPTNSPGPSWTIGTITSLHDEMAQKPRQKIQNRTKR